MAMDDVAPPSSLPQSRQREQDYRRARPLPLPLLDSCSIWIEEQLFSQAFALLNSTLTSGTGISLDAYVPPQQPLSLAATLIVHPLLTTRTTASDNHAAADDALSYLRHVNGLLGAREAGLNRAFQFVDSTHSGRGKRARARPLDLDDSDDEKPGTLSSAYVGKESIWTNAEDFWSVVGWAFNCAVVHRQRWDRWKLWLDLMLDILQDELESRLPDAEKLYMAQKSTAAVKSMLEDTMLAQYLIPFGQGRTNRRRLLRAVLADGGQKSLAEFGEIWRNETKPPKQQQDERSSKRRKLDLENGDFGDYFDESEDDSLASSVRRSRSTTAAATAQQSRTASDDEEEREDEASGVSMSVAAGVDSLGGIESIRLRQRILALMSLFCSKNPDAFLDTEDLFDLYTEFLRPLPLAIFQQFVLPATPWLGPNSQASLNQMLLRPLLSANAPAYNENALTQAEFETHYAAYDANNASAVDNAKVSLLIESLLRLLWESGNLTVTSTLRRLVQEGIAARRKKSSFDGRRKVGDRMKAEEEAMTAMECSADRMMVVLDIAAG